MGRLSVVITLLAGVVGCSTSVPGAVLVSAQQRDARPANLALGASRDHVWTGELLATRSHWPSSVHGYHAADTSYFYEISYDEQAFYENRGGSFWSVGESYRSGVLIR